MNASSRHHRSIRPFRLLALLVVAVLGLSLVSPAATSQVALPNALATQFFNALGGESPAFTLSVDAVLHTPEGTYTGAEGLGQFGEEFGASFSNVQFAVNSVAQTSDNFLIASFTLTGINTSAYRGHEANCAGIAVPGAAFLRLSESTTVADWWPMHNHNTQPPLETVTVVTEQWVNYDIDDITSQIAAFNAIDANVRPGCGDLLSNSSDLEPEAAPAPEPAPSCVENHQCALPY